MKTIAAGQNTLTAALLEWSQWDGKGDASDWKVLSPLPYTCAYIYSYVGSIIYIILLNFPPLHFSQEHQVFLFASVEWLKWCLVWPCLEAPAKAHGAISSKVREAGSSGYYKYAGKGCLPGTRRSDLKLSALPVLASGSWGNHWISLTHGIFLSFKWGLYNILRWGKEYKSILKPTECVNIKHEHYCI